MGSQLALGNGCGALLSRSHVSTLELLPIVRKLVEWKYERQHDEVSCMSYS